MSSPNHNKDPKGLTALTRRAWLASLGLLWLTLVVGAYFILHKPIDQGVAFSLVTAAARLGAAVMIFGTAGGLGRKVAPGFPGRPAVRMGFHAALGMGILALAWLLLGAVVGVSRWLAWGLLVVLAIGVGFREILAWFRQAGDVILLYRLGGRLERMLALAAALILWFTLLTALAPPIKFDALVYHLALPKAYLDQGQVDYTPWLMFWGMPQAGEMLYTWANALLDVQTAAVLGWGMGVMGLVVILGFTVQRFGATAGWAAVTALLCGYTFASSLAWGYVDWLALWWGACGLVALDAWSESGRWRDLIIAGAMAGFALGAKYTAGVAAVAGLGAILFYWRKNIKIGLLAALVYGFSVSIVSLPWWLKNAFATGNPFYPFFFGAGAMDAIRLALYQAQPPQGGWQDAWLLPWQAVYRGVEGAPGYSASLGPLLLGLGLAAFLGWRERPLRSRQSLALAASFLVIGLVVWALMGRLSGLLIQSRLYFSLFPAAALLAGVGFDAIAGIRLPGVRLRRLAGVLVFIVMGLNVIQVGLHFQAQGAARWLTGQVSTQEYLESNLGMYALVMQAIQELPPGAKVLMLWEPRSFYCRPACEPDEIVDRWLADFRREGSPQAVLDAWRSQGYSHLLYYSAGADYYRTAPAYLPEEWAALDTLLAELPQPVDFSQVYRLYSLVPSQ